MKNTIFTVTGCARCKITKNYLQASGIDYEEYDIKGSGKDFFAQFYRSHRAHIFRDKDGVEFPVFTDGDVIRQGVSEIIGHLIAGDDLRSYIGRSLLHGEWIDGFTVSGGNPNQADSFIAVLSFLRKNGLKIQITTNGANSSVLKRIIDADLSQRLIVEVLGPPDLYNALAIMPIDTDDVERTLAIAPRFPEFSFVTTIAPVQRADGTVSHMTPEEIGKTAEWIATAAGRKNYPYTLKPWRHTDAGNEALKTIEPLTASAMFKYRTAARRYMVMTEIGK